MPMHRSSLVVSFSLFGALWASAAQANMDDIASCRNISDDMARLACFDAAVSGVRAEIAERDETAQAALEEEREQRSIFGLPRFSVPSIMTRRETTEEEFGSTSVDRREAREDGTMDELEAEAGIINDITASVVEWGRNPFGKYFVVLENGHVWRLIDDRRLALRRNRENTVTIRRGRMGAFFIKANDVPAEFRVERIR